MYKDGRVSESKEWNGAANELPVFLGRKAYFAADGDLWHFVPGEGKWRREHGVNIGNWGLTGITRPDGVVVLVTTDRTTTKPVMITDDNGEISDAQDLGGPAGLDPNLSLDADGTVRVTWTDVVNKVLVTKRLDGVSEWTAVPGADMSYGNSAKAAVGADGRVDIVRRAASGQTVVSTQLEPNGAAFGPWQPVGEANMSAPDIVRTQAGQLVITFRDSASASHVYKRTSTGYVGGKIN